MSEKTFDFPAPRPWRIEGQAIWDANGACVVSALNPASMETRKLIVEAVNGRAALRDMVRRLCDELESHYHEPESMDDPCIIREAREVLGEGEE